uniref:Uncharacterized protein AlNc14C66G4666 n=1 Tax=Albugo laibachii Nc14 TaxID=890382 RepID=F0WDE6_9STRA|nr:conserved hypothetical protein [Albugo laibachii Nc14]|eukprot:CCA19218.1 conserved hypothetical protein [Albugo laibachii Nc14]
MNMVGKAMITLGVLLLFHAGYYTIQYQGYRRLAELSESPTPPVSVILEVLVAYLLCLSGVLLVSGEVLAIRACDSIHGRSFISTLSSPDFFVYNHRAAALRKYIASRIAQ